MTWEQARAQFPALEQWTHLNTATFGLVPARSKAAVDCHFARRDELCCQDFLSWFDDMDRIRGKVARLIHCSADDIAFVPNASTALSMLIGGIDWRPGDQIFTLADEFPNHYAFAGRLGGAGVELASAITDRTRVAAFSTVNYVTGYRAPLEELAEQFRSRGVLFYLDGTQSVGALEFDVSRVRPDIFAVDAYKWMLSPNGAGFVYVSPELREKLAPGVVGWRSDRNWRSVDSLHHGAPDFADSAEKYEGGMLNFASLYAMGETLSIIEELGPARIEQRVLDLAAQVRDIVRRHGATVAHDGSNIVAAHFPNHDAPTLARSMRAERVLDSARHGHLRISPHWYNNETDLDRFAAVLSKY